MTTKGDNTRVTVAILGGKIDTMQATLEEIKSSLKASAGDIRGLREEDVRLDGRIDRLSDRVSTWSGIQTAISAALAAVAGYIGTRN